MTRVLLLIPVLGVGLSAVAGIERAPHTNRLRFLFVSEEDERQLTEELVNETLSGVTILEDSDPQVQLVRHVCKNLCRGLSPDHQHLRTYTPDGNGIKLMIDPGHISQDALKEAGSLIDSNADRGTLPEKGEESSENPFHVYVVKDSDVNAASFGRSYVIVVNTGYLEYIQNQEGYLAATLAHEIAHILQRHTCEGHGLSHLAYMVTDIVRTLLWIPMAALGPFFTDLVSSFTENVISTTVNNRYNQPLEHEADALGLELMALAGYDPEYAVEFWRQCAQVPTTYILYDPDNDPKSIQQIEENWFRTHPTDSSRAERLEAQLPMALTLFEETLKKNGPAPLFSTDAENMASSDLPASNDQHLLARVIKKVMELWYGPVVEPKTESK
ncbi:hypothetical protein K493DRAFT_291341 [Basidiobolus meristosporus CBS 931.73]|uniref:Peptidase M48 domain-containing protein n=1 Tax=Basidiobolus meristosporus CBS 931.73 TaxID=1314790 RepID=A0A1Y1XL06_9FUNG|nr:hypothetical protein K493DRAFT_291341 [Basidiobolus meristosporus CBS 931.73]|eukprot:ORX86156.1 hypothetical protein K493DRAFT_291341 [Basidiobolus meristosporus CBS 931.73]